MSVFIAASRSQWKSYLLRAAILMIAVLTPSTAVKAQQNDLEQIVGKWSNDSTGEIYLIIQNFNGWDLFHSKDGQFAITTDGLYGSNLKMSGRNPKDGASLVCYYFVSINSKDVMTWGLRNPPAPDCYIGKFSRVPTPQELAEQRARVEATQKQADALAAAQAAKDAAEKKAALEKERAAIAANIAAEEAKKIADDQAAKRLADAKRKRLEDAAEAARGPMELRDIDVVYFDRPEDIGFVSLILTDNQIHFSTRPSNDRFESNVITCTDDVSLDAIKKLASILVSSGKSLYGIEPSIHPQFKKRMTIESYYNGGHPRPPLSLGQIENLKFCGLNFQQLKVMNRCDLPISLYVRYQRASDEVWTTEFAGTVTPGQTRTLSNIQRQWIETNNDTVFYFAFANREGASALQWTGDGSDMFPVTPDQKRRSFIRSSTAYVHSFTCSTR